MRTSFLQYVAGTAWGKKKKKRTLKSQHKLHTGKQLPFLSLSLSFQIPSQYGWPFLWACSKNALHNFAGTYSFQHYGATAFRSHAVFIKQGNPSRNLLSQFFTLTQGVCLKFFSSTEPTCCASADWYLFWAETSDLAHLRSFWSHSFQRMTQLRLGDLHPFESTTHFSHVKDL